MTTATQQLPSNPALDFANLVLDETNNAIELIDILHDIAQGIDEDATTHDRITASNILLDRGLGKCPKQMRIPSTEPERVPESAESDNHTNHSSDTPSDGGEPALSAAERSRRVTQIGDSLNQSLGPLPVPNPKAIPLYLQTLSTHLLYTSPSNSTSSPSPTTAGPSSTHSQRSPAPKTTRRLNPPTAQGPLESSSTESSELTPLSPGARLTPSPPGRNPIVAR